MLKKIALMVMLLAPFAIIAQIDSTFVQSDSQAPVSKNASLNCIVPPEGFVNSEYFNGYINLPAASSIILTEIANVNYIRLSEGMTQAFYDENKLELVSITDLVTDNGTKGVVYKFNFMIDMTAFVRYMVYAGDLNKTLWVNVTYPANYEPLLDDNLLKSFQTIDLERK